MKVLLSIVMSLRNATAGSSERAHPVAVESAVVTAMLVGVYAWQQLVREVVPLVMGVPRAGGLLLGGIASGGVFLGGLAAAAAGYTGYRGIARGLTLPGSDERRLLGAAVLVPVVLVGLTKVVGVLTDVPYNALTRTSVAADAPLGPILAIAGLGVLVGVPTLLVLCQLLIQGSFRRAVGGDTAVAVTTLVAGFTLVSSRGGLATVPDRGKLFGAVVFTGLLWGGHYVGDRVDDDRQPLAYVPLLLFGALVVLTGVAAIGSVAGGLFVLTHLAVVALAADTFRRTGSLLPPAVAYTTLFVANRAVVVLFEAGMRSW